MLVKGKPGFNGLNKEVTDWVLVMVLDTLEVYIGSLFNADSIHPALTGVSNRCPGSWPHILNAWVDSLLENIHLQRRLELPWV